MPKTHEKSHNTKSKTSPITHSSNSPGEAKVEKALIENFISLQKVLTNLAVKFDNLSDRINKLLDVFEISAKAIAEKNIELEKGDNKEVIDKIES